MDAPLRADVPLRVLIVEDSASDAALEVRALENAGYRVTPVVTETADGMKAALAEQAFDIVLADNRLPHFDMIKALAVLKASGLGIPFIVVSGTIGEEAAVDMVKAGADDYVLKDRMFRLPVVAGRALAAVEERLRRGQTEEALRESEETLLGLFDTMNSGCAIYEVRGDGSSGSDYIVKDFNACGLTTEGMAKEEIVGKSLLELRPAIAEFGLVPILRRVWQTGKPEYFPPHKYVDANYDNWYENRVFKLPGGQVVAIYDDISQMKRTEEALRESEERHRRLFETMAQGVVYRDANGAIVSTNPAAERILGLSLDQMIGLTSFGPHLETTYEDGSHFPSDQHPAMVALRTDEAVYGVVMGLRNSAKNERRWITVDAIPQFLQGETGPRSVYTVFTDITERKRAAEALRLSEEALSQSQKMEAMGQLAGGIAHDFNNLLTAILGYSDLILANGMATVDEVRLDMQEIRGAGERARVLTQQILAFSRRQALRPQVVLLDKSIRGIEPLLRRSIGEDIDLQITEAPELAPVEVDPHQFELVVMNLVLNARDAMPSGGRLTLETGNVALDEEFCRTHADATPGSYAMLRVSDTGVGMDAATKDRVFEPFFTTKAVGAGTGLGLATVYGIVKQSNGSMVVTSEPGRGSSFAIYLPPAAQPEVPKEPPIPPQASAGGCETVMVVEDEGALRGLIGRILGAAGYKTLIFSSAQEALAALEQGGPVVDLLLTDVMLAGPIQGHDLARIILASRSHLPVLYVSGYSRDALVHAGRLDEGVNLLEKPFTPKDLANMVREVLDLPRGSG